MKLKNILLEGYAWERKADGSLPTLQDAINTHQKTISEQHGESKETKILVLVKQAEDMLQNIRSNMATNSVLRTAEKMGYLEAFNELLDLLGDIGYEAEMEANQ
jgi:hypothetical protein